MPTLTLEISETLLRKITRAATLQGETLTEFIIGFLDRHIPDMPIPDEYESREETDIAFSEGRGSKNNIARDCAVFHDPVPHQNSQILG